MEDDEGVKGTSGSMMTEDPWLENMGFDEKGLDLGLL